MEDHLWSDLVDERRQAIRVADVGQLVARQVTPDVGQVEQAGTRRRVQRDARYFRSEPRQPQDEPGSLEPGVPGQENPPPGEAMKIIHERARPPKAMPRW